MTLGQQLRYHWQQSREQLRANPRLGWGIWCLLLILLLYVNLVMRDNRELLTLDLQSLQQRAAELNMNAAPPNSADSAQENPQDWLSRLSEAKAALAEQDVFFGDADNEALARADVQANVNSLLVASGLERSRIEVSAAPAIHPATGLIPLQLKVSGQARGEQLLTLLGGLEHAKPSYSINSLTVSQSVNSKQVNYNLLATVWFHPFEAKK